MTKPGKDADDIAETEARPMPGAMLTIRTGRKSSALALH
jgi:hypothetical protein